MSAQRLGAWQSLARSPSLEIGKAFLCRRRCLPHEITKSVGTYCLQRLRPRVAALAAGLAVGNVGVIRRLLVVGHVDGASCETKGRKFGSLDDVGLSFIERESGLFVALMVRWMWRCDEL